MAAMLVSSDLPSQWSWTCVCPGAAARILSRDGGPRAAPEKPARMVQTAMAGCLETGWCPQLCAHLFCTARLDEQSTQQENVNMFLHLFAEEELNVFRGPLLCVLRNREFNNVVYRSCV